MPRRDVGQAIPLVLATVAVIVVVGMAMLALGVRVAHRDQAQNAADACALAGATSGRAAAARVAASNHARLIEYQEFFTNLGIDVYVQVEVGGERAAARASTRP
jgi:hypothetical protein